MRVIGKIIAAKIVERDLSEVVNNDELTEEIMERYKYEDDKSEMYEVIEEVLSSR